MVKIVMKNASQIRRSFAIPAPSCKLARSFISGQEPESRFVFNVRRVETSKRGDASDSAMR